MQMKVVALPNIALSVSNSYDTPGTTKDKPTIRTQVAATMKSMMRLNQSFFLVSITISASMYFINIKQEILDVAQKMSEPLHISRGSLT